MSSNEVNAGQPPGHGPDDNFVHVSISTTAGFYPAEGFDRVPINQKVEVQLRKAQDALRITDVNGWIATVTGPGGKRQLDASKSYRENSLTGKVEIDWGPSEGGGG